MRLLNDSLARLEVFILVLKSNTNILVEWYHISLIVDINCKVCGKPLGFANSFVDAFCLDHKPESNNVNKQDCPRCSMYRGLGVKICPSCGKIIN